MYSIAQTEALTGLPQLGDGSEIASSAERRLGDRIARELYRDPDYIDDPVLADYVQSIWQPLRAAAKTRGELSPELDERFAWRIVLGRDRSVNAFALPGGYLGLHLGLLAVVSSKDELASVLAHELSHVTQRHIARLTSKASQQSPWMIGAMILGVLAASKNPDAGNAVIVGGQAIAAQNQLNFSRDMEREADRVGLSLMAQAGFEAQGFVTMFDKLQQASRLNDSTSYPYLRSHPLTTERVADMQSRLPLGATLPEVITPTLPHALLSARARVLSNSGVDALRTWATQSDDPALGRQSLANQAGVLYGAALAASHLRESALARKQFQRLQHIAMPDPQAALLLRWLGVEIELRAVDLSTQQLLSMAQTLAIDHPGYIKPRRPALLLQAEVALLTGQASVLTASAQQLQSWVNAEPLDALAWEWLARTYDAQGEHLRSLRAEAESRIALLDYTGALDRLNAAPGRAPGRTDNVSRAEHIEASIIDTRRRQIEVLLKEQALER